MSLMSVIEQVWTVVVCVLFIGIVLWAWSGARKTEFDAAAHMPLEEDDADGATHIDTPSKN